MKIASSKQETKSTAAVLLTFSLPETPYSIFTRGETTDTAVYKFQNRPTICHNAINTVTPKNYAVKNKPTENVAENTLKLITPQMN